MGKTVGIDLGTTFSLVAYINSATGKPECIPGPWGTTLCPSVVSLDADGKPLASFCSPIPTAPFTPSSASWGAAWKTFATT
jgi:hypothetical protein